MLKCFKKGAHTCARGGLGEGDAGGLPNEVLKDRADPERLIACGPRDSLICGETELITKQNMYILHNELKWRGFFLINHGCCDLVPIHFLRLGILFKC